MKDVTISSNYETKLGLEVVLYSIISEGDMPVHGTVRYPEGWVVRAWGIDGKNGNRDEDLVKAPKKIKRDVWLNMYEHSVSAYSKEETAKQMASRGILAMVKVSINCVEGDGL